MNIDNRKPSGRLPAIAANKCNRCFECVRVCPVGAILASTNYRCARCVRYCVSMDVPCSPDHVVFEYDRCDSCGRCIEACPHGAIVWFDPNA